MAVKKQVAFLPEVEDQSRMLQAVGLAVALMKAAKIRKWTDFNGEIHEPLVLLPGQLELLHEFEDVILLASAPTAKVGAQKGLPATWVYQCPDCEAWGLISSGQVPSTCSMTLGCSGKPVKAKLAKKVDPSKPETWAKDLPVYDDEDDDIDYDSVPDNVGDSYDDGDLVDFTDADFA